MSSASILIVEDEAIVALDLTQRLSRLGYRVVGAVAEGEKAVPAVLEHEPDLVLMDLRLAGAADGIQTAQEILQVRDLPIVYLTAHSDPQTMAKARLSRPFGYILKPFNERELHVQLEIALYRHGAERRVRESEEHLRAIMNTATDAILAVDASGTILTANPAAEEMFGYSDQVVIGRNADLLMPGFLAIMQEDPERWSRSSGGKVIGTVRELTGKRYDGSRLPIELTISKTDGPKPLAYIAIARDITRRKGLERELKERISELRAADRRKDEFLATLSHELRNPLAPIRNAVTILKGIPLGDADAQWCCGVLDEEVTQMTRLIEDLLDASRIARGSLLLRKERIDFRDIMRHTIDSWRPFIDSAGHELLIEMPSEEVPLYADQARLVQVFGNLLSNAVKFTEAKGRIYFSAKCLDAEVVASIKDTGIGISADFLPHIFEMFRQADSSMGRSRGGLGIGLALVQTLVDLHGGNVEAQSEGAGQGSSFTVRLPRLAAAVRRERLNGIQDDALMLPAERRAKRVLVLDDNKLQAESLGRLLELWGCEVRVAHDGQAALTTLSDFRADAALIDIGLPGMNGYEVACRIREQPQSRRMMLIAQTGWGRDSDREKTQKAGFDHHLTKPLDHQVLEKILNELPVEELS